MAGGAGWIRGWETLDARVWNSEFDGQHADPDVQRQLWVGFEDTNVKLRATVRRDARGNMTVQSVWGEQMFRGNL